MKEWILYNFQPQKLVKEHKTKQHIYTHTEIISIQTENKWDRLKTVDLLYSKSCFAFWEKLTEQITKRKMKENPNTHIIHNKGWNKHLKRLN